MSAILRAASAAIDIAVYHCVSADGCGYIALHSSGIGGGVCAGSSGIEAVVEGAAGDGDGDIAVHISGTGSVDFCLVGCAHSAAVKRADSTATDGDVHISTDSSGHSAGVNTLYRSAGNIQADIALGLAEGGIYLAGGRAVETAYGAAGDTDAHRSSQDAGAAVGQSSADDFVDGSAVNLDICVSLRDSTVEDGTGHNLADSAVVDNQMAVWMTALTGPIFAGTDNLGQGNVLAVQDVPLPP